MTQEVALDRVVPVLATVEAEHVSTLAHDGPDVWVLHLYCIVTVWVGTPAQQSVALSMEKKVNNGTLVYHLIEQERTSTINTTLLFYLIEQKRT